MLEIEALTRSDRNATMLLRPAVERAVHRLALGQRARGITDVRVECKVAIDAQGNPVPYGSPQSIVCAIIDYVAVGKDLITIIDHKSGYVRNQEDKSQQLRGYAALMACALPEPEFQARPIYLGINALGNPEHDQFMWLPDDGLDVQQARTTLLTELCDAVNAAVIYLPAHMMSRPAGEALASLALDQEAVKARPKRPMPCNFCPVKGTCTAYKEPKKRASKTGRGASL
jgi:hypothetical protein